MNRKFFEAISILIGTIVGAGIFALPYVIMKAGILIGLFYFIFLGLIVLTVHLIYGEIVLRTSGIHHFVGYGEIYLGKTGKKLLFISSLISLGGSSLVYLILGGNFLTYLFSQSGKSVFFYVIIFWLAMSLGIILGWRRISWLEFLMTIFLILVMMIIVGFSFSHFQIKNLPLVNLKYFFLPWGIIFYALSGGSAIPEISEVLERENNKLKNVIFIGTIIPLIIYFIFSLATVGALGSLTTEDTIGGIKILFGNGIVYLITVFGFLAVSTSYLTMGIVLKKIFIYDLKINSLLAIIIVCLSPLVLYLLGLQNFIKIISFLGLWLGAVEGILLLIIHQQAKKNGNRQPEYSLSIPKIVYYLIGTIFILGPILSIIFLQY